MYGYKIVTGNGNGNELLTLWNVWFYFRYSTMADMLLYLTILSICGGHLIAGRCLQEELEGNNQNKVGNTKYNKALAVP